MGNPETGNFYPTEQERIRGERLEQIFRDVREGEMLQFMPNKVCVYEYDDTGETEARGVRVGESEYRFRVPVKAPFKKGEVRRIETLSNRIRERYRYDDDSTADKIDTKEFNAWKESLISPENIQEAAKAELERRKIEGDTETISCTNCKGQGRSDCPYCEGCGEAAKYPYIILKNEVTTEERVLKLDLAALIVEGEIKPSWGGYEKMYAGGDQTSEKTIIFNVSDYIDKNIAEIGVDKGNAAIVKENGVMPIWSGQSNVSSHRAYWSKRRGQVNIGIHHDPKEMTPRDVLDGAQASLSRAHAWPWEKIKDENGVIFAEEWRMRPLKPMEERLGDLKTALFKKGQLLGFSHSFIATGETGPSFFALDIYGNVLSQLSNDYDVRESLENAWLKLQKMNKEAAYS